jgi:hypothetical protein
LAYANREAAESGVVSWVLTLSLQEMAQRVIVEQFVVSGGTQDANFEPRPEQPLAQALSEGWKIVSSSSSAIHFPNGAANVYGTFVLEKTEQSKRFVA